MTPKKIQLTLFFRVLSRVRGLVQGCLPLHPCLAESGVAGAPTSIQLLSSFAFFRVFRGSDLFPYPCHPRNPRLTNRGSVTLIRVHVVTRDDEHIIGLENTVAGWTFLPFQKFGANFLERFLRAKVIFANNEEHPINKSKSVIEHK